MALGDTEFYRYKKGELPLPNIAAILCKLTGLGSLQEILASGKVTDLGGNPFERTKYEDTDEAKKMVYAVGSEDAFADAIYGEGFLLWDTPKGSGPRYIRSNIAVPGINGRKDDATNILMSDYLSTDALRNIMDQRVNSVRITEPEFPGIWNWIKDLFTPGGTEEMNTYRNQLENRDEKLREKAALEAESKKVLSKAGLTGSGSAVEVKPVEEKKPEAENTSEVKAAEEKKLPHDPSAGMIDKTEMPDPVPELGNDRVDLAKTLRSQDETLTLIGKEDAVIGQLCEYTKMILSEIKGVEDPSDISMACEAMACLTGLDLIVKERVANRSGEPGPLEQKLKTVGAEKFGESIAALPEVKKACADLTEKKFCKFVDGGYRSTANKVIKNSKNPAAASDTNDAPEVGSKVINGENPGKVFNK